MWSCGKEGLGLLRGRRRRFCSDKCRLASHRRRPRLVKLPAASGAVMPPPTAGEMGGFISWVRETHEVDSTAEQRFRLLLNADRRLIQAAAMLNTEGLTMRTPNGALVAHPAVAIEKDARAAIARLIRELGLEESNAEEETTTHRRWPARRA